MEILIGIYILISFRYMVYHYKMTDIYREFLVSRSLISNEESLDKLKRFFSNLLVIFFGLISPCVALVSPNMLSAFFDFNTNRAEILKMYEHYYDNRNK